MSTGKVVSHPSPFPILNGTNSDMAPYLGGSTHTNMPLTPPDSPSSDDEEKGSKVASFSDRKHDSSSGSDVEGDDDENYAHSGRAGGANHVGGILIHSAEDSRAWKGSHLPGDPPERGKESLNASRSVGGRKEGHHVSGEGGSGGRDSRSATVCVMQQKGGAQSPMSTLSESSQSSTPMGGPPLRSVLKRSGQRSRGHRVSINEAKNEVVEADYVILIRDEDEPQLVSIRTFDLGLSSSAVDQVTLSPPEGYKDVFGHAIRETIDDSDTENGGVDVTSGWGIKIHDPDCPRANLPDVVVSPRCPQPSLTVENVRHHDQMMEDIQPERGEDEGKVAKTGILKGGKLWKNGGDGRKTQKIEADKTDRNEEPRRSVRFSGRDEYTTLDADMSYDKIPFDIANEAALACFLSPKFQKLGELLGEQRGDWHVELSPLAIDHAINDINGMNNDDDIIHHPTCAKHHHKLEDQMDDEHISESVQRYDEMRRRIAAAEGRDNNSICSDESKSSSDSQSSDSATTESRIRRLENNDAAQVAGGVMRSNSEVRRAIERNALRRSLIRFAEARKKDTNRNEKSDKQESSLIEKLKWLTASEDATNGNANEPSSENEPDSSSQINAEEEIKPKSEESNTSCTIEQYRKLAEMFNRTTSLRPSEISVPGDVREWKLESDLFPCEKIISNLENDELPPGTLTYTAVPAVSVCDQISDDESEKLIYSGGIRYTKEGTLPEPKEISKNGLTVPRERSHTAESYSVDDIDEVLHDDRSSSVPSSSQSSPRLSGRSDVDGTSTAESGYSSNETNSELSQMLPPELDELAEFVKQDAGRIERLKKRYDESDDHGFCRRPSVRGIKPRFGSTTDLLNQMANQLLPPNISQTSVTGSHMTWPYRDVGEEDNSRNTHQRRRVTASRNNTLPALQEDVPYATPPDLLYNQVSEGVDTPTGPSGENKPPRIVHVYSSTGDLRALAPPRLSLDLNESLRHINQIPPQRAQSYSSLPQVTQYVSNQLAVPNQGMMGPNEHHYPTCISRRPASVHGHAPTDMLVSGPQHPTPRPLHTISHQSYPRAHCQSHEDLGSIRHDISHSHFVPRGSYPIIGTGSQYPPNIVHDHHNNVPITYQHSSQNQGSQIDLQSPGGHQSSSSYASKRLPSGHYERNYCSEYHSSNSNPNFVHNSHAHPLPIVSSQLSYTTPIVPEAPNSRLPEATLVNGMLMKMEMERGVPEGASSSPRVMMDSQFHPSSREPGLLHHHPPQVMNVST